MFDTATPSEPRAAELVILGTVFLDVMAIGIIVPVFPELVTSISGYGIADIAGLFALFSAVFGVMQFISAPILGAASDCFGRRPVIILSNLVSGVQFALMALAPNLVWLFVGRVISGLATGSMPAANAWIADVVPAHRRAARFGLMGAAMSLGFAVGPAIGGFLGSIDPRAPFWAAAIFSLLNGAFGYFVLKESLPPERRVKFHLKHSNPFGTLIGLVGRYPVLGVMFFVACLFNLAGNAMMTLGVLYTTERYQWDSSANGLMLMGFGGFSMLVQVALIAPLVKLLGQRPALLLGIGLQVLGFAIFGFANSGELFWLGIPVMCFGSLSQPIWNSLLTQTVSPLEQGRLSGVSSSLMSLVSVGAPFAYAGVFATSIMNPSFPGGIGASFFMGSLFMLCAVIIAWYITRKQGALGDAISRPYAPQPLTVHGQPEQSDESGA